MYFRNKVWWRKCRWLLLIYSMAFRKRHLVRGHLLNYSYARLQTCWIHSEDLVAPVSITSVGLYVQCLDWQCISFVKVKKYSGFIPDKFGDRNSVFRYNSLKKKMLQAHNDKVQSHNWPPDAVQGKSKQILSRTRTSNSWCVRSGWHTVGL